MQNPNAKSMRFLYLKLTCFELSKSICLKEKHFHFFAIQNILQKERNKKMDSKNGLLLDFVVQVCKKSLASLM
jgi:hypothetical protein